MDGVKCKVKSEIKEPTWLKTIPCYLLLINLCLYLLAGAFILRLLDGKLSERPFYNTLIIAFELTTTIGWGGRLYGIYSKEAKIFAIFYTLFGVPIMFSAVANGGWLITRMYHFILNFIKPINKQAKELTLPLRISYLLLLFHQLVGIVLFNYVFYNFGIIASVYFSIVTIATTGLGDFIIDPPGYGEALLDMIYLFIGITIMSCVYASSSQYIQYFYFVTLKRFLKKHVSLFRSRSKAYQTNDIKYINEAPTKV